MYRKDAQYVVQDWEVYTVERMSGNLLKDYRMPGEKIGRGIMVEYNQMGGQDTKVGDV